MAIWLHSVSSVSASLFDTEPVYSCPVFSCFIFTFICCFSCPWHLSQCLGIVSGKWHRCTSVWNPTLLSWSCWVGTELPLTWKDGLTSKAELSSLHLLQIKRCLIGRRDSSQKWPRILFLCDNIHFFCWLHPTTSTTYQLPYWCYSSLCMTTMRQRWDQGLWWERQLISRACAEKTAADLTAYGLSLH